MTATAAVFNYKEKRVKEWTISSSLRATELVWHEKSNQSARQNVGGC